MQALLEENPAKHPIIILKDVPFQVPQMIYRMLIVEILGSDSYVDDFFPMMMIRIPDMANRIPVPNPKKYLIVMANQWFLTFQHLTAILEFMYAGEVNVAQVPMREHSITTS